MNFDFREFRVNLESLSFFKLFVNKYKFWTFYKSILFSCI